jgi:hypothetical protein
MKLFALFFSTTKSKIFYIVLFLCILGLLFSLSSFGFEGQAKTIFSLLSFYFSFLWCVWIFCLFTTSINQRFFRLLLIWLIVDLSILLYFISIALDLNFSESHGMEVLVAITYAPIAIPIGLFLEILNISFLHLEGYFLTSVGKAFGVWLEFSILASIQSLILLTLSQRILHHKAA